MMVFYVDEAGCLGTLPTAISPIQPVFAIAGIVLRRECLQAFTLDWLNLKERFFPNLRPLAPDFLDWIMVEIKGSELRKSIRQGPRDPRRHALGFMDKFLHLLEGHNAKLLGRIYVKPIGPIFNGRSVYTSAIQAIAVDFQQYLAASGRQGLMVLDSRYKAANTNVSHSVFTQKFQAAGDAYNRLMEMPMFGHSDNHAGIQAADMLCSAFLFPMAAYVYCQGHVTNLHVHLQYCRIRDLFGERLKRLQFRYQDANNYWRGGITVSDAIGHQRGSLLFSP